MTPDRAQILEWLSSVPDPEVPVVSIAELGIIRDIQVNGTVTVSLAPTYSGCPATEVIEQSVIENLQQHGVDNVRIKRVLSPAWTTDWISESGLRKLKDYGIAPPAKTGSKRDLLFGARVIRCPRCESESTRCISEFGSTACKAAYVCDSCLEPFEYFKCI